VSLKLTARGTGNGKVSYHSPAEQFNLYPIGCDKSTVPNREETAEVGAPPEVISGETAGGELRRKL